MITLTHAQQRLYAASKGAPLSLTPPEEFYALIGRVCALAGIAQPSPESMALLHGFLTEHFIGTTGEDLELAVKMNLALQLPSKVIPYGELSAAFVGDLLRQYEPIRGKAVVAYRELEERIAADRQLPARKVTDEEWRQMIDEHRGWIRAGRNSWQHYINRYISATMVEHLWDSGLANDAMWSNDEWRQMRQAARREVMRRREIGEKGVERMSVWERERYDAECIAELRTVVYGDWLLNKSNT